MRKKRKINGHTFEEIERAPAPHRPLITDLPHYGCPGCMAREEQLVFLREQVRSLQDKLLCLVPEAADRDHRLRLTQVANMRPEALNGIVPLSETTQDNDERAFDNWFNDVSGMNKRG